MAQLFARTVLDQRNQVLIAPPAACQAVRNPVGTCRIRRNMLHIAIAIGLVLAFVVGLTAAATGNELLMAIAVGSAPLGRIFMNAIQMAVIPLVMAVIFVGVARLGNPRTLGRLGGLTLGIYWSSIVVAILIGISVMKVGLTLVPHIPTATAEVSQAPEIPGFMDFIVSLVPSNPFAAASSGKLLPLIVFVALFAAATGALPKDRRERLILVAEDISNVMIKLVWWVLLVAPVGVFGLAAPVTAQLGWGLIQGLAVFIVSVIAGLGIFVALVYIPLVYFAAGIGPLRFFSGTFGAASVAFSTTSTAVTLPVSLKEATDNLGVSKPVADLVVPLGASMFRPGSALFQGAAIIYLAHLYQVPIPAAALSGAILASFLVALTVAPVPSSSVVTLTPALDTVGVPVAGLAVLLGVDRIPDMFRTAVNALGQILVAVVVDKWLGHHIEVAEDAEADL
jgi:Na+/H+-dicarboxylate symporter